jgi:hypothetical protein
MVIASYTTTRDLALGMWTRVVITVVTSVTAASRRDASPDHSCPCVLDPTRRNAERRFDRRTGSALLKKCMTPYAVSACPFLSRTA